MGSFVSEVFNTGSILPAAPPPSTGAGELVKEGWDSAQVYARQAFDDALSFIDQMENIGSQLTGIPDVSAEVGPVTHPITGFAMPTALVRPDLSTRFPDAPNEPTLGNVSELNLPAVPEFVQDIPAGTLTFLEPGYSSALQTSLKTFLNGWVNGVATGIAPNVEQAMWDRARAREDLAAIRARDTIRSDMAGRGFPVPPGAMNVALMAAAQEANNRNSSLSRDIAIKQAELEQSNRQFAVTAGIQLENQLLNYANQMAQRIFEVAQANLRGGIDLYQTAATVYGARANGYAAVTQALIAQQNAEIKTNQELPMELFKSRLSAFDSLVKSESARLGAISTTYETDGRVYSSTAQAEGSKAGAEADIYRAEVQYVLGVANTQVEVAKAVIARMTSAVQLLLGAVDGGAKVSAQLAAASLSAVNLSGQISDHSSVQSSTNHGNSFQVTNGASHTAHLSESHEFKEK